MQKIDHGLKYNPLAGKVICGCCGKAFGRRTWNCTGERLKRKVGFCNGRYEERGIRGCDNKHIYDKVWNKAFIDTFNTVIEKNNYFVGEWKENLKFENDLVRYKEKQFIKIIEKAEPIKEFNVNLFCSIIEKMTMFEGKKIIVSLLDGTEIEVIIE